VLRPLDVHSAIELPPNGGFTSEESPKKIGRGYARNLDAEQFQSMIDSWGLHLRAERKSAKPIRTYLEAAQWFAAGYLIPAGFTGQARRLSDMEALSGSAGDYCHQQAGRDAAAPGHSHARPPDRAYPGGNDM
jgi:hypothetical protein